MNEHSRVMPSRWHRSLKLLSNTVLKGSVGSWWALPSALRTWHSSVVHISSGVFSEQPSAVYASLSQLGLALSGTHMSVTCAALAWEGSVC